MSVAAGAGYLLQRLRNGEGGSFLPRRVVPKSGQEITHELLRRHQKEGVIHQPVVVFDVTGERSNGSVRRLIIQGTRGCSNSFCQTACDRDRSRPARRRPRDTPHRNDQAAKALFSGADYIGAGSGPWVEQAERPGQAAQSRGSIAAAGAAISFALSLRPRADVAHSPGIRLMSAFPPITDMP